MNKTGLAKVKKIFGSKSARIIYALIIITCIMVAVGYGIIQLIAQTGPKCPDGQTPLAGKDTDGTKRCYNKECAEDCPDNSTRDFSSKQPPQCGTCQCDDGYTNTESDKSKPPNCKPICGDGGYCKSNCVFINDSLVPSCENTVDNLSKCGQKSYGLQGPYDVYYYPSSYTCADEDTGLVKRKSPPEGPTTHCDNDKYETGCFSTIDDCPDVDGKTNSCITDNDDRFNQERKSQGKKLLGTCQYAFKKFENCQKKGTATVNYSGDEQNINYCTSPDAPHPSFDKNSGNNCCNNKPCTNGHCPNEYETCTSDGGFCLKKNYNDTTDKCCTENVYKKVGTDSEICPQYAIYIDNNNLTKCSSDSDCDSKKSQKCISLKQKDGTFKDPVCRAVCNDGEMADNTDNSCKSTNKCSWSIETGFSPLPAQNPDGSPKNLYTCSSTIPGLNSSSNRFWNKYNGNDSVNYELIGKPTTKFTDVCKDDPNALKTSCAEEIDGTILEDRINMDIKVNNDTAECDFTINCNNTDWIKQNIHKNYLSAMWDGTGTYNINNGKLLPYIKTEGGSLIAYNPIFLSNGLYCENGTRDGLSCISQSDSKKRFTDYCQIGTTYPNGLECDINTGNVYCGKSKYNQCCGKGGYILKDSKSNSPICKYASNYDSNGNFITSYLLAVNFRAYCNSKILDVKNYGKLRVVERWAGSELKIPGKIGAKQTMKPRDIYNLNNECDYLKILGNFPNSSLTLCLLRTNGGKYLNISSDGKLVLSDASDKLRMFWCYMNSYHLGTDPKDNSNSILVPINQDKLINPGNGRVSIQSSPSVTAKLNSKTYSFNNCSSATRTFIGGFNGKPSSTKYTSIDRFTKPDTSDYRLERVTVYNWYKKGSKINPNANQASFDTATDSRFYNNLKTLIKSIQIIKHPTKELYTLGAVAIAGGKNSAISVCGDQEANSNSEFNEDCTNSDSYGVVFFPYVESDGTLSFILKYRFYSNDKGINQNYPWPDDDKITKNTPYKSYKDYATGAYVDTKDKTLLTFSNLDLFVTNTQSSDDEYVKTRSRGKYQNVNQIIESIAENNSSSPKISDLITELQLEN